MTRSARWLWLDEVADATRTHRIGANANHLALTLGVHHFNGQGFADPGQDSLARTTGLSIATIRRATRELQTAGLLEVKLWHQDNGQRRITYHLTHRSQ